MISCTNLAFRSAEESVINFVKTTNAMHDDHAGQVGILAVPSDSFDVVPLGQLLLNRDDIREQDFPAHQQESVLDRHMNSRATVSSKKSAFQTAQVMDVGVNTEFYSEHRPNRRRRPSRFLSCRIRDEVTSTKQIHKTRCPTGSTRIHAQRLQGTGSLQTRPQASPSPAWVFRILDGRTACQHASGVLLSAHDSN